AATIIGSPKSTRKSRYSCTEAHPSALQKDTSVFFGVECSNVRGARRLPRFELSRRRSLSDCPRRQSSLGPREARASSPTYSLAPRGSERQVADGSTVSV